MWSKMTISMRLFWVTLAKVKVKYLQEICTLVYDQINQSDKICEKKNNFWFLVGVLILNARTVKPV